MSAITPFRLDPGQNILLSGISYSFLQREKGRKQFLNQTSGHTTWVDEAELNRALRSGELQIRSSVSVRECRNEVQQQHFADLPPETQQLARMRLEYVLAMNRNRDLGYPQVPKAVINSVHEKRRQRAFDDGHAFKEKAPGLSSVYEWRTEWNRPGRPTLMRLVFAESKRGKRGSRKSEKVRQIVVDAIRELYLTPQRHLVSAVSDRVTAVCTAEGMPDADMPCERTVRREIQALSPRLLVETRHGKRAADLIYAGTHKVKVPEMPGEVLEVDAHKLNLIAIDETGLVVGRIWVTVAIDRCTRVIVGFHVHVGPPSSLTIAACIRNAIEQKDYMNRKWPDLVRPWTAWGVPLVVMVDNAFENKAEFLIQAADEIGFVIFWAKPRTPEDKPHIERWFGTAENGLIRRIPGNTGLNPQDLGDYDAAAMACATEADVEYLMHLYVTTIYNNSFHRGINDIPERLWNERTAEWEVTPYTNQNSLEVLLGHIAWRVPSRKGIELLGLLYNGRGRNDFIEHIRSRAGAGDLAKVKVRFDPQNLDAIWVQDPATGRYEVIESEDPDYTRGMTLARHRAIRAHAVQRARGHVTVKELCIARDYLQRRIEEILGCPHATGRRTAYLLNANRRVHDDAIRDLLLDEDERDLAELLDFDTAPSEAEVEAEPGIQPVRAAPRKSSPKSPSEPLEVADVARVETEPTLPKASGNEVPDGAPAQKAALAPEQEFVARMREAGIDTDDANDLVSPDSTRDVAEETQAASFAARMAALGLTEEDK